MSSVVTKSVIVSKSALGAVVIAVALTMLVGIAMFALPSDAASGDVGDNNAAAQDALADQEFLDGLPPCDGTPGNSPDLTYPSSPACDTDGFPSDLPPCDGTPGNSPDLTYPSSPACDDERPGNGGERGNRGDR